MDIQQIKQLKAELEEHIKNNIRNFEIQTGTKITDVDILRNYQMEGTSTIIHVQLKVSIDIS